MQNINVIVVPEMPEYIQDTTFHQSIYINSVLGEPNLKARNAKYIAPYWLTEQCVDRVYHILGYQLADDGKSYVIELGNSFKLKENWNNMGNHRKFEYHNLLDFGFVEIKDGLLLSI